MQENEQTDFGKIDLVNIENQFSIFMYINDLAYNQIPEQLKHYSINLHNNDIKFGRKPNPPFDDEVHLDLYSLFKIIMKICWRNSVDFSIIDVGSQYGSFSMSLGAFIKKEGRKNKVYSFDCGIASNLCKKNIELNLLSDIIKFEKMAVSDKSSPQQVFFNLEHSEDNHIVKRKGYNHASYEVEGITLDDYFKSHKEFLIIKIDTQGAESKVFDGMKELLSKNPIIVFEFSPSMFDFVKMSQIRFLKTIKHMIRSKNFWKSLKMNPTRFLKNIPEKYTLIEFNPSTKKIFQIDRSNLDEFVKSVSESTETWTDILLLNKEIKGYDEILNKITMASNYSSKPFNNNINY